MIEYISASDHYKRVLTLCSQVKHILWIGTADIKDLYIEMGKQKIGAPDKPCGVGRADANPKLLLNDT